MVDGTSGGNFNTEIYPESSKTDRVPHLPPPTVNPPPSHVIIATHGYGHTDHISRHSSISDQSAAPLYLEVPPRKKRRVSVWIIFVIIACIVVFVVEMYVNNCPANRTATGGRCVLSFLGRLSFQPIKENPLFGPSISALRNMGALVSNYVRKRGQWWRLFTAMWLHAGSFHLLVNMFGIWYIGNPLEQDFGSFKVGTLYILSGLGGSLLSALFLTNQVSVGASGALFGLVGASLSELILNWSRYTNGVAAIFSYLFVIILNLLIGLMPYVDNFAHIGGLLSGFLLGFVLFLKPRWRWEQAMAGQVEISPLLPPVPRNTATQKWARIIAAILFVILYVVAIVVLSSGVDPNESCSWCHYLSCVPTSWWTCSNSVGDGTRTIQCRAITQSDGSGYMVCPTNVQHFVESIGTLSSDELSKLCSQLCS